MRHWSVIASSKWSTEKVVGLTYSEARDLHSKYHISGKWYMVQSFLERTIT
mgnify:FL=1|jgi:hypothetical protein